MSNVRSLHNTYHGIFDNSLSSTLFNMCSDKCKNCTLQILNGCPRLQNRSEYTARVYPVSENFFKVSSTGLVPVNSVFLGSHLCTFILDIKAAPVSTLDPWFLVYEISFLPINPRSIKPARVNIAPASRMFPRTRRNFN